VLIGFPSLGDNDRFAHYRPVTVKAAERSVGNAGFFHEVFVSGSTRLPEMEGIVDRYNCVLQEALSKGCDFLWLLDLDVEVPEDAFEKLLGLGVDVALGYYPSHRDYNRLIAGFLDEKANVYYFPRQAVRNNILSSWVFAGTGCVLIKRRVLEAGLRFKYQPWKAGPDMLFMVDVCTTGFSVKLHGEVACGHLPEWPLPKNVLDVGCGEVAA